MHQSVRHEVLNSLGIRSWYCKYTITNAAETPANIYSKEKRIESCSVEADTTSLSGLHPIASVRGSAQLEFKAKLVETKSVEGIVNKGALIDKSSLADKPDVIKSIAPELTLSVTVFGDVTVISEQSASDDNILERVLLGNIISVITGKNTESIYNDSVLSWPVFKSRALIKEQSLYFESVSKSWLEAQKWSECNYVFYFGDSFSALEAVLLGIKAEQSLNYMLVSCSDSLNYLLGSPIKKKNLWSLFSRVAVIND
tara:strand:+ start:2933 stop:3700 length:768 start_codon:yes stop_codon:yes gene_type:complete